MAHTRPLAGQAAYPCPACRYTRAQDEVRDAR